MTLFDWGHVLLSTGFGEKHAGCAYRERPVFCLSSFAGNVYDAREIHWAAHALRARYSGLRTALGTVLCLSRAQILATPLSTPLYCNNTAAQKRPKFCPICIAHAHAASTRRRSAHFAFDVPSIDVRVMSPAAPTQAPRRR